MIQDNQTNMVYLAHGLSHYVPVCRNLLEALHQEEIHAEFVLIQARLGARLYAHPT